MKASHPPRAPDLIAIYGCLCDRTRLRILHLLLGGPLCVCHFQEVLREPQVKVSKHLRYLKRNGLVQAERCANMMIYRLPPKRPTALAANLACLQDCAQEERVFQDDARRLKKLRDSFGPATPSCVREPGTRCD
jgi:ArsR family transcriptional regulator